MPDHRWKSYQPEPEPEPGPITPPIEDRPASARSAQSRDSEGCQSTSNVQTVCMSYTEHEPDDPLQSHLCSLAVHSDMHADANLSKSSSLNDHDNILEDVSQSAWLSPTSVDPNDKLGAADIRVTGQHQDTGNPSMLTPQFTPGNAGGQDVSKGAGAAFKDSLQLKLMLEMQANEWAEREIARLARQNELLQLTFQFARKTIAAGEGCRDSFRKLQWCCNVCPLNDHQLQNSCTSPRGLESREQTNGNEKTSWQRPVFETLLHVKHCLACFTTCQVSQFLDPHPRSTFGRRKAASNRSICIRKPVCMLAVLWRNVSPGFHLSSVCLKLCSNEL